MDFSQLGSSCLSHFTLYLYCDLKHLSFYVNLDHILEVRSVENYCDFSYPYVVLEIVVVVLIKLVGEFIALVGGNLNRLTKMNYCLPSHMRAKFWYS